MILVRTDKDVTTSYIFSYCDAIIKKAQDKGIKTTIIEADKVCKEEVVPRIKKLNPHFVCLNGHGSKDCFYGQNGEKVITLNDANSLKGTITFARACDCLTRLGEKAVDDGCRCFIGYGSPFIIPRINGMESRPDEDPAARPIIMSSNEVPLHLIKGSTANDAVEASGKFTIKELEKWLDSKELYASAVVQTLLWNHGALGIKGNSKAKIS